MAGTSVYLAQAILNWLRSTAMPADPAAIYLALFVGDPEGAGAEVSGNNYSRTAFTLAAPAGSDKTCANDADIVTAIASGSWGTVDYVAIYYAAAAGNRLASGALSSSVAIGANDRLRIAAGDLDVAVS